MDDQEKKYPKIATGIFIINRAGKIFLMRSQNKFGNQYYIPGGHIDWGETAAICAQREVKEETGLEIYDLEFLRPVEFIFYELYSKEKHFISLNYVAKTDAAEGEVVLDGREATEYIWLFPDEIIKGTDVDKTTQEGVRFFVERKSFEQQCAEYKSGWQRAVADYKNLQKETQDRRQLLLEMSEQQILEEFIPVYDNFKKAFNHKMQDANNKTQENWVIGIEHIKKQFGDILKQHKVEEIKTVGEKFDPKFHETAGEEESEKEAGTIVREVDGGYVMNGRVIKAAKVIISKSK